jgi:hypothetical protein
MKTIKERRAMKARNKVVQLTEKQLERLNADLPAVLEWIETNIPLEVRWANSNGGMENARKAIALSDDTEQNVTHKAVALSWLIRFVMEINDGKRVVAATLPGMRFPDRPK